MNCDGKQFIVEIFVTHAVDDEKKEKIKQLRKSAIEINLSRLNRNLINKEILVNEICDSRNFSWVYDADIDCVADKKEIIQKFGLKIPIQIGDSISCPLLLRQKNEKNYVEV